jgi:hypothetical protein
MNPDHDDELAAAIAKRLARLRGRSVNAEELSRTVRERVSGNHYLTHPSHRRMSSLRVLTVGALLAAVLAAVVTISRDRGGVLATSAQLAEIHFDNAHGDKAAVAVGSIESAERILSAEWSECPPIPKSDAMLVRSCHLHKVSGKRLACVEATVDGTILTLAVAHSDDFRLPGGPNVIRNGMTIYIQSSAGINIVIAKKNERWVCLMADLPTERLVEITASLRT